MPAVGCVICGSDRHQAARCCAEIREREMMARAAEEITRQRAAGIEVGRHPPRYAWWRHVLGWAFVLSVLGVGLWGAWVAVLWVVTRLGAAWRGGGP